jgi:hypothetical protein
MKVSQSPLSPLQRKTLLQYKSYYEQHPTLSSLIVRAGRHYSLMFVVFLCAAILCFMIDIKPIGYTMIGMLAGALSRDLGTFRRLVMVWPAIRQIVNWQAVDSLLSETQSERNA